MVDLTRVLPSPHDSPEDRNLKVTVYLFIGVVLLMLLIGLFTFTIFFRGHEETLVPNVLQKDLISALVDLQEKDLNPRIQVRFSSEAAQGVIMEQKPVPGTVVKAGRRVNLVVSKGPVIDRVGNYVNQKLEDVKSQLLTVFASYRALLKIKEPVMYTFSTAPAGTILAQKPEPGTELTGLTFLELVVSRGPKGEAAEAGNYVGRSFEDVLAQLSALNLPFTFTVRGAQGTEGRGVVVSQSPEPGSEMTGGAVLQLVMTRPGALNPGEVFGLFEYVLPDYPIMVDLRLEAVTPAERRVVYTMKHAGGPVSIPYRVPGDAELVLYIFDREEIRRPAVSGGN
jgi:beta-lactam-binding protein with PASTA domain